MEGALVDCVTLQTLALHLGYPRKGRLGVVFADASGCDKTPFMSHMKGYSELLFIPLELLRELFPQSINNIQGIII